MKALNDSVVDSKGRISLGKQHAGERYVIVREGCRLILERAVVMLEREVWLHKNREAKESVLKGLEQAKEGRLKSNIIDLDESSE